jgi:putative endonuclease
MRLPIIGKHGRSERQIEGDAAEQQALRYLERRGMTLVTRNFRCKGGEIDLILQAGATLVFVEVRKRADSSYGGAAASVTPRKQARILIAAQIFLQRYKQPPPCRIDVVALDGDRINWLQNAIEA